MFTGCTGFRNGILPPSLKADMTLKTWPQAMGEAGYDTWWVGKWHLSGRPSMRGIDECLGLFVGAKNPPPPGVDYRGLPWTGYLGSMFHRETPDGYVLDPARGGAMSATISETFADAAIEFLQRKSDKPFFLQVNFTAPHDPLMIAPGYEDKYRDVPPPANFAAEHPFDHGNAGGRDEILLPSPRTREDVSRNITAYYAVITHLDAQIGRVLDALETTGEAENTIVIFSSDHGLALGSHGLTGKQNMYEHTIGVPLIIAGPSIAHGEHRNAQCYLRDLYPTACELCGVAVPESVQAKSLVPVLRGEREEIYPFVVGYYNDVQRMIRGERWKYIWYPKADREQLFDVVDDPNELHDRSGDPTQAATLADLRSELLTWLRENGDPVVKAQ